jgi:transcription antitermination protein NusB
VVALYQHDLTGRPLLETLGENASLFARALTYAAADRADELDAVIDRHAHGWSVQRIQPLERSIMRVALIEMLHPDAAPGEEPIPAEGAIEEAVESAKTFCGSEAPAFVNGVLAAVLREVREDKKPSEKILRSHHGDP